MSTNHLLIGIVVLIALVGGYLFLANPGTPAMTDEGMEKDEMMEKKDEGMKEDATMEKDGDAMMEKDDAMTEEGAMMEKGSYEAYAPEKLALANEGDVVLFFRAPWCPTCRALDADIRANLSMIPAGLTILDVDYDSSTALKQKYGVTYQHTFVQVSSDGTQIKKWSGSPTLAAFVAEVQ